MQVQYRMHPCLSEFPSNTVYGERGTQIFSTNHQEAVEGGGEMELAGGVHFMECRSNLFFAGWAWMLCGRKEGRTDVRIVRLH